MFRVACKNAGVVGESGASRPEPIDLLHLRPMHFPSLALAALIGWTASAPALAQASSVEHDALLYLDSQVLPKKAAACSARISGFSGRFDPAFSRDGIRGIRPALIAVALTVLLQVGFTYWAPMQRLFGTRHLDIGTCAVLALASASLLVLVEAEKALLRRWWR